MELHLQIDPSLPTSSDKCIFPPSVLSDLVDTHFSSENLPHPLIFSIVNSSSSCYVGVKQFSAPESTLLVPGIVGEKLGGEGPVVIKLEPGVEKATFLQLKPLQFYPEITSWKYYLEARLSHAYTTLTVGQTLVLDKYQLVVEDSNAKTVCIVDTDATLDVVPLNDIMANQQLEYEKNLNYLKNIETVEHELKILNLLPMGQSLVPQIYKVDISNVKLRHITIKLSGTNDLFNIDVVVGLDKLVNLDNFKYTTMDQDFSKSSKLVVIDLKLDLVVNKLHRGQDADDDDWKYLFFVPFTWDTSSDICIEIIEGTENEEIETIEPNSVQCTNCRLWITKEKLQLHEVFCFRNNKRCSCGEIFLRQIPSTHWHCEECGDKIHGDLTLLRSKHAKLKHSGPYTCTKCGSGPFQDFIDLVVNHKAALCPEKLHECKFCHLILPQEAATFEDNFVNLTHHENSCGNKTTECYKCGKIFRTKDFSKHLKIHEMEKQHFNEQNEVLFRKCCNDNCINQVDAHNNLHLCSLCYGPLYVSQHDPTNIKLQLRIERKYMLQLTKGCGNSWCTNENCATGSGSTTTVKDALQHINNDLLSQIPEPQLPVNNNRNPTANKVWFCVSEGVSRKKQLVETITMEGQYQQAIVLRAVNEVPEDEVRLWLSENGVEQ